MATVKQSIYLIPDTTIIVGGQTFYKEDANGYIPASKITYDDGSIVLIVYSSFVAPTSFEGRIIRTMCKQYLYLPSQSIWTPYDSKRLNTSGNYSYMQIDDNTFVDANGIEVTEPYEDDLTKEILDENGESYTPKRYEQKLKAGVKTEYQFWFDNLGKQVIFPAMQNAGNGKF